MSYDYETEKAFVFTDEGQRHFLKVRDKAHELLKLAGAVSADTLLFGTGNSWSLMACVDRLVELGELVEIKTNGAWQHRIFKAGRN